jgi:hypothetical protein
VSETVPADIAAAIAAFAEAAGSLEADKYVNTRGVPQSERELTEARAALDAAILHHLRAYAEMKAALERIEAGT